MFFKYYCTNARHDIFSAQQQLAIVMSQEINRLLGECELGHRLVAVPNGCFVIIKRSHARVNLYATRSAVVSVWTEGINFGFNVTTSSFWDHNSIRISIGLEDKTYLLNKCKELVEGLSAVAQLKVDLKAKLTAAQFIAMLRAQYFDMAKLNNLLEVDPELVNNVHQNRNGYSLLMMASSTWHVSLVRNLLARGSDYEYAAADGSTALMVAAESGIDLTVDLLLEKNATYDLAREGGETALSLAFAKLQTNPDTRQRYERICRSILSRMIDHLIDGTNDADVEQLIEDITEKLNGQRLAGLIPLSREIINDKLGARASSSMSLD